MCRKVSAAIPQGYRVTVIPEISTRYQCLLGKASTNWDIDPTQGAVLQLASLPSSLAQLSPGRACPSAMNTPLGNVTPARTSFRHHTSPGFAQSTTSASSPDRFRTSRRALALAGTAQHSLKLQVSRYSSCKLLLVPIVVVPNWLYSVASLAWACANAW